MEAAQVEARGLDLGELRDADVGIGRQQRQAIGLRDVVHVIRRDKVRRAGHVLHDDARDCPECGVPRCRATMRAAIAEASARSADHQRYRLAFVVRSLRHGGAGQHRAQRQKDRRPYCLRIIDILLVGLVVSEPDLN